MTNMEKDEDHIGSFFNEWANQKKTALETGDFDFYKLFLMEANKTFLKLLSELTSDGWKKLVSDILQKIAQEIKWVKQKQTEKQIPF